ncbi:amidohydrolase [Candidatus Binatia bacterium]|jgi:predicted TIM-barrel fold metal-dependent hydrolase|nr:amidohydrolase [Candidatus Binatia bacterium]
MHADDLILVSVDDHVVEPPGMFEQHLPVQYKSLAPKVVRKKDGTDVWYFNGNQIPNLALNAVVGRPPEEYGMEPTSYEQLRPGCYDVHERVKDMNANGVLASMCFPSFPSFTGMKFAELADKNLAAVMIRAYNDWHIDEWCGTYPGRFIPLALPIMWDPQLMADEVRRVAKKGCHALSFTESPEKLNFPSFHSAHWDPLWKALSDEGTVLAVHIGSGAGMQFNSMEAPVDVMITTTPMKIVDFAADILWSRVLKEFPQLRVALSEGGIGWIPYFLERADYVHEHHHAWTHQDFGGKKPSEVWREHMITCFIDDPIGIQTRNAVGLDTITWECDYPHSDTTWPKSPEALAKQLVGVPDADVNKITHENALRTFRLDAFKYRPREKCTAKALRAESPDVDLSMKSVRGSKPPVDEAGLRPVTTADVMKQLAGAFAVPVEG